MLNQKIKRLLIQKRNSLRQECTFCINGCQQCDWWYDLYLRMANANIPSKFWDHVLKDFDWCTEVTTIPIRKYVINLEKMLTQGMGLYLWGRNSVGKSFVASLILKAALIKSYTVYFTSFETILTMVSDSMYDRDLRYEFRQKIVETDFLVVDDIDKTYRSATTFVDSKMDAVFRERANYGLPTIITSNVIRAEAIRRTKVNATEAQKVDMYAQSLLELFNETLVDVKFVSRKSKRKEINQYQTSLLFD